LIAIFFGAYVNDGVVSFSPGGAGPRGCDGDGGGYGGDDASRPHYLPKLSTAHLRRVVFGTLPVSSSWLPNV